MGLTEDVTAALAKTVWGVGRRRCPTSTSARPGSIPPIRRSARPSHLADELIGFPRHLSQHVGGFVLTRERLDETVPIGNAAMEDRTFIEWDKDDIDALGMMKVDVLALGMLTCLRRGLRSAQAALRQETIRSPPLPQEDPAVYEMLSRADSVGVFQVESRAQMSMLPRLKPRMLLRSGHRGGDRAAGADPGRHGASLSAPARRHRPGALSLARSGAWPADELEEVLKTLGVPLFQEQAMQIAIDAAKFTPDEADGLRRAMATFRHNGTVHLFREKFIDGMIGRGYDREFAERCFSQIEGFGEYGFPESHAASFALLVYVSAWIKCHYPDVFCAAILNSQPMGFYQPAQLVRDAREHGVEVRAVDVNFSDWDCTLEPAAPALTATPPPHGKRAGSHAVRLGFRLVHGLERRRIAEAHRGARQRLCQHRTAGGGRRRFALHHRAAGRGRCVPLAGTRSPRRAVGRAAARRDRHSHERGRCAAAQGRSPEAAIKLTMKRCRCSPRI